MKKVALISLTLLVLIGCLFFFTQQNLRKHQLTRKGSYARIPLQFIGNNVLMDVEIEGEKYPIKLDLGASSQFTFFSETLKKIHEKKFLEFVTTIDVKGNEYKVNSYSIPYINAKNLSCKDAIVYEEPLEFVTQGARLWRASNHKEIPIPFVGRIGRGCFTSNNLFIDFPNSMMFVTSDMDQLKMDHWPICDLFEVPFEMGLWGIILSIETDVGIKRLILDTGASASVLKKYCLEDCKLQEIIPGKEIFTTKKFAMNKKDFGPFEFSVFEITDSLDADGFLGIDFLKNYAVYLDFKHNKVFIGPSPKICGAIIFDKP